MESEKNKYWFFGSKLNTALLLALIILMVIALRWMYQNKEVYIPVTENKSEVISDQAAIVTPTKDVIAKEKTKTFSISKVDVNKSRISNGITTSNRPGFSIEYNKDYDLQVNYDNNCEPSACFAGITVLQPTGAVAGIVSVEEYMGSAGDSSVIGKETVNGIVYEKRQSNSAPQLYIYTTPDMSGKYVITIVELGKNHEVFNLGSLRFIYN